MLNLTDLALTVSIMPFCWKLFFEVSADDDTAFMRLHVGPVYVAVER
jgi:hypothetical protein